MSAIEAPAALNRVPKVTPDFWLVKLLAVTMGETAADYLAIVRFVHSITRGNRFTLSYCNGQGSSRMELSGTKQLRGSLRASRVDLLQTANDDRV